MDKYYITTPIYYVNGPPHIGSAYTTIAADMIARYHRMLGEQTFFLAGTDEHGEKNEEAAVAAGIDPQQYVDKMSAKFQLAWDSLDITYDNFIRTTDKKHVAAASKALEHLYKKGFIYKGKYEGLYCVGCEQYKTKKDLVDGLCPEHKKSPVAMSEESYLFKLSAFADELKQKIEDDELRIRPLERKNEVLAFYEQGLRDVSFSRKNIKWGVPLPWDKEQVSYVWPDAFLNYLTGLQWNGTAGKAPKEWPADVHLVGKDIIRVHATIWPAMLLALGLPLPKQFFVHGYFTVDGQKMSKSLGNVVDPVEVAEEFDLDVLRYYLFREITFGKDGDFSLIRLKERYTSELVNGLGNLVARVLGMGDKYCQSKVPQKSSNKDIEKQLDHVWLKYKHAFASLKLNEAVEAINDAVTFLDGYIQKQKPWELASSDPKKTKELLYCLLESIRQLAWLCLPIMPAAADKIFEQLGLDPVQEKNKKFEKAVVWGGLEKGVIIKKGEALFPRK